MTTTTTAHARRPSVDAKAMESLEKRLQARPDKSELVERNILKRAVHPLPACSRCQL